jgi:hypothetical protein
MRACHRRQSTESSARLTTATGTMGGAFGLLRLLRAAATALEVNDWPSFRRLPMLETPGMDIQYLRDLTGLGLGLPTLS